MRVYRVHYSDADFGNSCTWHGSKREAEKASSEAGRDGLGIELHNIPTKKRELLEWLNLHFSTDNG